MKTSEQGPSRAADQPGFSSVHAASSSGAGYTMKAEKTLTIDASPDSERDDHRATRAPLAGTI